MDAFIGQCFKDRYQVLELLGRQTGRRTFLAKDLQTQTQVVLKLMLFGPDFSWEDLKLFEREAATLKSLDHPAIPQYLDYFELSAKETTDVGRGFALVQSYIEAKSLQDWADEGRHFSGQAVREIATQLLEVLIYLHGHQPPVIHRDIKPSNILLGSATDCGPGQAYLVDFGSVQTTHQEGTITIVGTYGYMPPEQFSGKAHPASDLYSLGATLIYLLIRRHPADLPMKRGQMEFDVSEFVSDRTQSWLRYLVHPSVVQRLTSARWTLDTLTDENLPLQSKEGLYAKPRDTQVTLRKTVERMEIIFPSIPLKTKIKVVAVTLLQSAAFGTSLLFCLWTWWLSSWSIAPLMWCAILGIPVSSALLLKIWMDTTSTLSTSFQLMMNPQELYYIQQHRGKTLKTTIPIDAVNQISKSFSITRTGRKRQLPMLNIWTDSSCLELSHIDCYAGYFQLSWPEVDWLGSELSDWLNLPVRMISQQQAKKGKQPIKKGPAKPYQPNLPEVTRPGYALCTVRKDADVLEVFAPKSRRQQQQRQGDWKTKLEQPNRGASSTVLRIQDDVVSLWDTAYLKKYVAQAARQDITRIRIVYKPNQADKYHVQLEATHVNTKKFSDHLLVGDRKFWLSQQEAHWLAYELSYRLRLPVCELAVVSNRNPALRQR